MSSDLPSWYVAAVGNPPSGPFTAEQIVEAVEANRLDTANLCWREGMPQWLPITQVEPFARAVDRAGPFCVPGPPARPAAPAFRNRLRGAWERLAPLGKRLGSILGRFGAEAWLVAGETVNHLRRLRNYGMAVWKRHALRKAVVQAQLALGVKMHHAGVGDARLREQISALDDRIESVKAAKASAKALNLERKGLCLRLAQAAAAAVAEPGAEIEHSAAVSATDSLAAQEAAVAEAKASLRPADGVAWRRTAVGYGATALLLCGLAATLLWITWASADGFTLRDIPVQAAAGEKELTSLDREAAAFAISFWKPTKLGDSYYLRRSRGDPRGGMRFGAARPVDLVSEERLYQLRGPRIVVSRNSISEADQLNGLTWQGRVSLDAEAVRTCLLRGYGKTGKAWSEWSQGEPGGAMAIERRNGQWTGHLADSPFPDYSGISVEFKRADPADIPR